MPRYSPEVKSAAHAGQEAAEWSRSISGAFGIEGSHRYLYAAAFFDLLARVAGRIYEDPPRRDFTVSARPRTRSATPSRIRTDDPFERLGLEAAETADEAEALLAAHLRAFERFQGALRAGDRAAGRQRSDEAQRYAGMGSGALRRLATLVTSIAEDPSASERRRDRPAARRGRPRVDEVGRESLSTLFLGGLRIRDLENVLSGVRLEEASAATPRLLSAAEGFRQFAEAMARWTPPTDSELVLDQPWE